MSKVNILNLKNDDDVFIIVDKPNKLDDPPIIDDKYVNAKYTKICSHKYISKYFENILAGHERLICFNGINLDGDGIICDFCYNVIYNKPSFFCYHCYGYVCNSCYEKPVFLKCKQINNMKSILINTIIEPSDRMCDLCNEDIDLLTNRYASCDGCDVCMECYENNSDAQQLVKEKDCKLIDIDCRDNYVFNYTDFGSIMNWVPIIADNWHCHILMNLNPEDKNYGKLCMQSCDDHGRFGYYIIYDESVTLDTLLDKLKTLTDKGSYDRSYVSCNGDDIAYETCEIGKHWESSPVQILMHQMNMITSFG